MSRAVADFAGHGTCGMPESTVRPLVIRAFHMSRAVADFAGLGAH